MAEYTPSDEDVRTEYLLAHYGLDAQMDAGEAFDRWLTAHDARVRRDAAREALAGLMHRFELEQGHAASLNRGLDAQRAKLSRLTTETYRDTHYPETEDQP